MNTKDSGIKRRRFLQILGAAGVGSMVGTIIDLETTADTLSIRCHGADALIAKIEAARTA